jgi:hypothetical protein
MHQQWRCIVQRIAIDHRDLHASNSNSIAHEQKADLPPHSRFQPVINGMPQQ